MPGEITHFELIAFFVCLSKQQKFTTNGLTSLSAKLVLNREYTCLMRKNNQAKKHDI